MTITLAIYGPIKNPFKTHQVQLELEPGATIRHVLETHMGYTDEEMGYLMLMVDGAMSTLDTELAEGVTLTIFLPVGGG